MSHPTKFHIEVDLTQLDAHDGKLLDLLRVYLDNIERLGTWAPATDFTADGAEVGRAWFADASGKEIPCTYQRKGLH